MPKNQFIPEQSDYVAPFSGDIPAITREIAKAGLKAAAEGEAIIRQVRKDGFLSRPFVPNKVPPKIELSPDPRSVMIRAIKSVLRAEVRGRKVAAGLGLTVARERYELFAPHELPPDERTWPEFVRKHAHELLPEVDDLIGRVVHFGGQLHCIKCGTATKCPCGCGAPYVGEHPWTMPVAKTVTGTVPENVPETRKRGRPPAAVKLTEAERKRMYRERKRNLAAPAAPPPPEEFSHDLIQEEYPEAITPEQRWQWSMSNAAGDAIAMRAFWSREFGQWQQFAPPTQLVTLAHQAASAWKELAHDLERRRRHDKAEAAE